jgi:dTDP-4-amino-4,6-dideoxygalactose transaminase
MKPQLPEMGSLERYLKRIDLNRRYTNHGDLHGELTSRLSKYFSVLPEQIVLLTNGTIALEGLIETSSEGNAEWSIPSWTFAATGHAVQRSRRIRGFIDVQMESWRICAEQVSADMKQVVDVAPFGDLPRREERWPLTIVDAASCFDSAKDLAISPSDNSYAVMISLHATKLVSTGEGAVVVTGLDWAQQLRTWSNFGFWGDRIAATPATNAKISEYQAAIGLASMDEWEANRNRWVSVIEPLRQVVESKGWSCQPAIRSGFVSSTFICQVNSPEERDGLVAHLAKQGIETRQWWANGLHKMPAFSKTQFKDLTNTNLLADTTVGLPLFIDMQTDEQDRIRRSIENFPLDLSL